MKIFHELPLGLMHHAYEWTDGDYCLPIFLDKYEQYKLYFQKAKKDNRFIIMDNSLFEGYVHTTEDLLDKINLIKPNIFIVPDAWNDSNATLVNAKSWILNYKPNLPEGVELMAVVQGKNLSELINTYQTLVDIGYTHIAFNHSSQAYIEMYGEPNNISLLTAQMLGRINLIKKLTKTNIIRKSVYHHLLGASDWREFEHYNNAEFDFIKSVDTSAPIINGAEGVRFDYDMVYTKPKHKLEHYFEMNLENRLDDIKFNVEVFKSLIK